MRARKQPSFVRMVADLTGISVDQADRAYHASRSRAFRCGGERADYFARWSAVAAEVGVDVGVQYIEQEIATVSGGTTDFPKVRRWLSEWRREQRTGRAVR